jgi:cysteinyl-tRNA synthetase
MDIRVYNTLSNRKELFTPAQPGRVSMYVCGITAYDFCHIGHARSAIVFDMLYRYLRYRGFEVIYVRNFTDVDDKIIRRAAEEGCGTEEIATRYMRAFYEDMDRLGVARPTHEPRATEFIPEMVELVETLLEKGYAYQADGNVYFAVEKFPGYGKLSKRNLEDMMAGARVEVDANKRQPLDFALWKASKPGEPAWPSPWGQGRPGWHIECSVMSTSYLGTGFDIHGGGKDLIFPHHENEIAQSEAAYGNTFTRYWIHNGFVNVDKEKMSKSLGNFFTIRQVLERFQPEVLRLFLLSSHYRSPVDFSEESMLEAERRLERFYQTIEQVGRRGADRRAEEPAASGSTAELAELRLRIDEFPARFREEMDNDFNTAAALGHLFELTRAVNRFQDGLGRRPDPEEGELLARAVRGLRECAGVLGLLQDDPAAFFQEQRRLRLQGAEDVDTAEVERLVAERAEARRRKDWARADEIRDTLAQISIVVEDRADGTHWRVRR